jgi:hypothetical protein
MDPAGEKLLREAVERRTQSLREGFRTWRDHGAEIARYTQPRLSRWLSGKNNDGDQLNNKLLNARGTWSSNILANGMHSGMASPSMPWFKVTTEDPDLSEFQEVKEWLAVVEDRLYSFFARTNYYTASKSTYMQLGLFGTSAKLMIENEAAGGAVNYPLSFGEYWIGLDEALNANTLLRRVDMTTIQLVERFGLEKLPQQIKDLYARGDYQTAHECYHLIEPNNNQAWGRQDAMNKPFRSYYWLAQSQDGFLRISGFEERPFSAPRWEVTGTDTWGRSPAMDALPDLRALQLMELRKSQAIEYGVTPPLVGPTSLGNSHVSLLPRSITTMANVDKDSFRPIWQIDARMIEYISRDIELLEQRIDRGFNADLFNAITNMPGVQPRNIEELARRNEEKLTQLGPVIDRNQNEQLRVDIDRAYGILLRGGYIPDPPEEIAETPLRLEFIGILAQAQRLLGVGSIERGVAFIGNLAAAYPDAADKLDVDQTIDEYTARVGMPPKTIRSDDQVAKLRESRAQQMQAAQAAEAAAVVAPAMQQGADAARLLSETDDGSGSSMLARLLGTR